MTRYSHGTRACYRYGGCTRTECHQAALRYDRRRRKLHRAGKHYTIPTGPTADFLDALYDRGFTSSEIIARTGLASDTLRRIRTRTYKKIRQTTAQAITGADWTSTRTAAAIVPAYRVARRLQALAALGHPNITIAQATGIRATNLSAMQHDRGAYVYADTFARVAAVYRALAGTPGVSGQRRRYATSQGWAPPLAWDNIDDPDETPHVDTSRRGRSEAHTLEDADWLVSQGLTEAQAAERLGIRRESLQRMRARAGVAA